MMPINVRIVNKNKKDPNNKIYEEATLYFMRELLNKKKKQINSNVIRIDIKTNAIMSDDGECFYRTLKDNSITIRVKFNNNISFFHKIVTLRHECVHAKQFMTNELDIVGSSFIWKGKKYNSLNANDKNYKLQPWEREAYRKQKLLTTKFINFYLTSKTFN